MSTILEKVWPKNVYFLFLLPIFFVLHGYTENYPLIKITDGIELLLIYLLSTVTISLLSFFIFKDGRKAAVFTFLIMGFNFFFGSVHDLLNSWMPSSFFVTYLF